MRGITLAILVFLVSGPAAAEPPDFAGPQPAAVDTFFFVTGVVTNSSVTVEHVVSESILITGIDLVNTLVSNDRCVLHFGRDPEDSATGVGNSTTLFQHAAVERGTIHYEFSEPALVSADRAFQLYFVALGGNCQWQGIVRFKLVE
jgi:hypothetical protein